MNLDRLLAWCGIVGPVLFSIVVGVLGAARPGYSHISQPISALGGIGSPNSVLQDANFLALGALTMAFAYGLRRGIPPSRSSTLGASCVAAFGLGVFLSGVFPCETCAESGGTAADAVHGLAGVTAFFGFLPAPFLLARGMSAGPRWRGVPRILRVLGVATVVLFIVFLSQSEGPFGGLFQRIFVGSMLLVLEILALRLYRVTENRPSPSASA